MEGKKWYQKISNWIFAIVVAILLAILAVNIHITFQAHQDENVVPNVFGYKPFIVLSGSMETQIHVGDMIITKIIDPSSLNIDDVIAFRDEENTVTTHRVIDIVEKDGVKYFVTKGDNNNSQDKNLVEYKDVEGIYVARVPFVGTILNEIAKPANIIIIVMGITIIFILLFIKSNKKLKSEEELEFLEYKKQKELKEKQKKVKEPATTALKTPKKSNTKTGSSKNGAIKTTPKINATKSNSAKKVATKKTTQKQTSRKHS